METNLNILLGNFKCLFKSYYVVWKPILPTISQKFSIGLNRTMQYGNFFLRYTYVFSSDLFKSYYVVWKQISGEFVFSTIEKFKSYYVVWKLPIKQPLILRFEQFKSYYVVWKRQKTISFSICVYCLNRTMQYGNKNSPRRGRRKNSV